MNPNAKPFVFSAAASEWTPPSIASAPGETDTGSHPLPTPPTVVPAPVLPPTVPTLDPIPVSISNAAELVQEPEDSDDIDENDPLWKATIQLTKGDRAEAMKLLEDPDNLMNYPEIRKIMDQLDSEAPVDDWDTGDVSVVVESKPDILDKSSKITAETVAAPSPVVKEKPSTAPVDDDIVDESQEITDGDPREHLNLVFIGHVDAGKSTLSGNILYISGMVDQRTIERYEREAKQRNRESWFLAFIMDTSEEERAKGKTVEVGRALFGTEKHRYTILDAPGHKNYVPNMISGATQADVGVLVISARRGEFETGFEKGGQTREHAMLAKTLGVRYLVVVINKMDDSTVLWDQNRFDECCNKLKPYLKSCGYAIKKEVKFIPISAIGGDNLLHEVSKEKCPWWSEVAKSSATQPTLFSTLDSLVISGRDPEGSLRIPVLDRYFERGTVVMGKIECGTLRMGEEIAIVPTRGKTRVDAIYVGDTKVRIAKPGENVLIKLPVSVDEVHKGYILCSPSDPCPAVCEFRAQLALVDMLDHRPIFSSGYDAVMHLHTVEVEVTCMQIISVTDNKGQSMRRPFAKTGQLCVVVLKTLQTTAIETYEKLSALGRITLRDEGKTIAIGKVIKLISMK
eukprot:CAMPEP_0182417560 /NCGR_PEP_ID=MMETSP1167-20130531/2029_1 /TAXON_ID=2988 /ORGANISM="Mallomonas Sp, Strain CCMP3275" /LENGTH=626 /DNA_ID=CAMNT_0024591219 /DNA_START=148 /DNA_END=2028 /DNA_ORIENTATION=-